MTGAVSRSKPFLYRVEIGGTLLERLGRWSRILYRVSALRSNVAVHQSPPIIWCAPILVNLKRMPVSPRSPCYKKLGGTGFGGPDSAGKLGFPPSPWNSNTATALIQRGF